MGKVMDIADRDILARKRLERLGVDFLLCRGTTGTHVVSRFKRGSVSCSCIGYRFRGRCRHIERLCNMKEISLDELIKGDGTKRYESSLQALNKLFGGEAYNTDEIMAIYGKPKVGKSLLCVQEAYWFMTKGLNVLYIDTEGSSTEFIRKWVPVFEARFGERKGNFWLTRTSSLGEFMEYLGYKVSVDRKKGKMEFRVDEILKNPKIENTIKEKKIDVMFVDSVSAPMRIFTTAQQDQPAKADAMAQVFMKLMELMEKYNVAIITVGQATYNPANPYEIGAEIRGGIVMHHYCKRVVYLDRRSAKEFRDYRRFWLVRAEDVQDWSRAMVAKIDDTGYVDVDDDDEVMERIFTDAELKRLT